VASGSAIAAGPALLPHRGWMAGFEDIDTGVEEVVAAPEYAAADVTEDAAAVATEAVPFTVESLFGDVTPPIEGVGAIAMDVFGKGGGIRASQGAAAGPALAQEMVEEARALLGARDYAPARERLADALRQDPRNRTARALYHMASAEVLLAAGKEVEATTQLEVAMAHDPTCKEVLALVKRVDPDSRRGAFRRRR